MKPTPRPILRTSATRLPQLLTFAEAAQALGLKAATIYAWSAARKIPVVRVGAKAVRVSLATVEDIIARGTIPAIEARR